jgi:hypothetical protein
MYAPEQVPANAARQVPPAALAPRRTASRRSTISMDVDVRRRTDRHHQGAYQAGCSNFDVSSIQPPISPREVDRTAGTDHLDELPRWWQFVPGSSVRSTPTAGTVDAALLCCISAANCSQAEAVTRWFMRASRARYFVTSAARKRSGCSSGQSGPVSTLPRASP